MLITCPNCKTTLSKSINTFDCLNGHSFDISKDGAVNLLLPNQKKKLQPGDNKSMINARELFLSSGNYDFLIDSLNSIITKNGILISNLNSTSLVDLGCGTGYYTRNIGGPEISTKVGIDISKFAIAKAAKKDKSTTYIVGSVFNLPIEKDAVDLALNIFSPIHLQELERILKPGGYFLKVIPIGNHMKEIAELVYEKFNPHQSSIDTEIEALANFSIVHQEELKQSISISKSVLENFISMTPYVYKFKESDLSGLQSMEVTVSFKIFLAKYNDSIV